MIYTITLFTEYICTLHVLRLVHDDSARARANRCSFAAIFLVLSTILLRWTRKPLQWRNMSIRHGVPKSAIRQFVQQLIQVYNKENIKASESLVLCNGNHSVSGERQNIMQKTFLWHDAAHHESGPLRGCVAYGIGYALYNWNAHIDGLEQERRNSSTLAMELRISCTKPSIWERLRMLNV